MSHYCKVSACKYRHTSYLVTGRCLSSPPFVLGGRRRTGLSMVIWLVKATAQQHTAIDLNTGTMQHCLHSLATSNNAEQTDILTVVSGCITAAPLRIILSLLSMANPDMSKYDPPQKCPLPSADPDSYLISGSMDTHESTTQTSSRSVHLFLQGSSMCLTDIQTTEHQ